MDGWMDGWMHGWTGEWSWLLTERWMCCNVRTYIAQHPAKDWLHNEWEGLDATLQSATLSRDWLLQMGAGAQKHGLFVQYVT